MRYLPALAWTTRTLSPLALLMALSAGAHAQATGSIRGKVTEAGTPVPVASANVVIVGSRLGALTTNDGNYTILGVPPGSHTLRITRIGFVPLERTVNVSASQETVANFEVDKTAIQLEQVVTTATGEQSRRSVGNAVAVIDTDSLVRSAGVTNPMEILTARVSGVTVVQGAGMIGSAPSVVIRGRTSVFASSDPLWIIDGMRMVSDDGRSFSQNGNSTLGSLSPEDIESIDIIKGPSATALYGTQANNGVIVVKTKRGRAGRTQWSVWNDLGLNDQPADWPANYRSWGRNLNSSGQPTGGVVQCRPSQSAAGSCQIDSLTSFSPFENPETTPFGDMGRRATLGASASGGTDRIRFYSSAEIIDERGPYTMPDPEIDRLTSLLGNKPRDEQIHPNALNQLNFRGNFNAQLTPRSELAVSGSYTDRRMRTPFNGSFFQGIQIQGLTAPGYRTPFNGYAAQHLGDIMSVHQPEKERRIIGNMRYSHAPISWLNGHASLGIDQTWQDAQQYAAVGEGTNGGWGSLTARNGGYRKGMTQLSRYSADLGATATANISTDLTSRTSLGAQWFKDDTYSVQYSGWGLAPGATTIPSAGTKVIDSEGLDQRASYGIFIDQSFAWRERLYLTTGLRYDASNIFGPAAKRPVYPRAQLSYVISDEDFFPEIAGVDRLRLRTSWGESGAAPGPTQSLQVLTAATVGYANSTLPTLTLVSGFNPGIKPEITSEIEAGLDATLLGERMNLEFTLYKKTNRNGITTIPLAPSLGAATQLPINLGRVENKGFEYGIDLLLMQRPSISWDMRLSGSHSTNKVLFINGEPPAAPALQRIIVGYPIQGAWSRPITAYSDANGDGIIAVSEVTVGPDWEYIGPVLPTDEAQFRSSVGLFNQRVSLTAMLDYRAGHFHQYGAGRDRCNGGSAREANDPTAPLEWQAACVAATNASLGSTQWGYIKPGDFLKLREASITFQLPRTLGSVTLPNGTISFTGRNLSTLWTEYPGLDPEAGGQFNDNWTVPPLRYFLSRINITF